MFGKKNIEYIILIAIDICNIKIHNLDIKLIVK